MSFQGIHSGLSLMASPLTCDDTMMFSGGRPGRESMIQMLQGLTEEDHRQCLVGESAWAGER